MTQTLPAPQVVRCYFDTSFAPHLPAMCLRWEADDEDWDERAWELPEGVRFNGSPPRRFGIRVQRQALDSYSVHLLWERTCLTWLDLTRGELLQSDLAALLSALGTDLWYLLDQPLAARDHTPPRPPERKPLAAWRLPLPGYAASGFRNATFPMMAVWTSRL